MGHFFIHTTISYIQLFHTIYRCFHVELFPIHKYEWPGNRATTFLPQFYQLTLAVNSEQPNFRISFYKAMDYLRAVTYVKQYYQILANAGRWPPSSANCAILASAMSNHPSSTLSWSQDHWQTLTFLSSSRSASNQDSMYLC